MLNKKRRRRDTNSQKNMGHLTNFELVLVVASVGTFCYGLCVFMTEVFFHGFNKSSKS